MAGDFSEFHDELRSVAADLLAKERTVDWVTLVDAGWVGLEIDERYGGAGATFAETAVICTELGRAASTTSYLGGAVLAVATLNALAPSETRDRLLNRVASGDTRLAVALEGPDFVPDAPGADHILIVGDDGVTVAAPEVTPRPVVDETRSLGAIDPQISGETLEFDDDPVPAIERLRNRAAVAVACDSLGLAEAMLARTVSYVKVRHQFGRPIGSFQAVKHTCADMYVEISICRQLIDAAVAAIVDDAPDVGVAAAMAKSHVCPAAVEIASKAMQLHGGIGYTWESGIHVYLKRATLNRALFGSPAAHRSQLAKRYR
ncbi:acyl-CoA dehydrogenase, C-terminal domain protein [Mycolicibacterium hassiacum DSM 44199]|mgnify:CR=1 FL=1|jgi:alkylation response protein AidB-like acyl-CoA dehydrogenase|uniref:Acyl-CoA dehydrogenase, C-terminal domain protein n=1 Tax=Mycolicibacterium hassiacum (strain DSM 44199 / CIP 105218 / JCM 12690 / 3849) TaxID=1122247 RepID=K5BEP9_MYCHD|nr:acyl-CoA dehydrogenase family protein [Mycolicibacterium hassiacum]EKF22486.1 acyl-CoA dehydrogenase, C-terminal domain protein [Mycolicibacterium hassiacum DSM 44199]MBX5487918.1 acyl-CoA/acyl-ACP dehydrogenase [Mycolicibacterium hassiacum]MDA4084886.1 acyl-CoA dehydrogenase [Mycolicibacterium hassiacum DSM 44199]PZN20584.1 MAG: acyl-CoA dehydrogenase [Mycolicibacterium hassiacum]VCT91714.1 Acyl-CoA dehydrogenase FadE28 [Mycolicibacterium hassiacum DSM 44199]